MEKQEILEILKTAGIDVDDLMERLMGNMSLISRFMKRFPDDGNYPLLVDSIEKGDCEEAFRAAHTLKGVVANLSMTKLYKLVGGQVEVLRVGDMESGSDMLAEIIEEYEKMVEVIRSISWE